MNCSRCFVHVALKDGERFNAKSRPPSKMFDDKGYCWACWQPEVVAIATPIVVADWPIHVLNMSVSGTMAPKEFVASFHKQLLDLANRIRQAIEIP